MRDGVICHLFKLNEEADMRSNSIATGVMLAAIITAPWAQVSSGTDSTSSHSATPMTHLAVGTVTSIDTGGRSVTIDHQAIPSLGLPAMTMQFRQLPSLQPVLKPGESIAFTFTASADGLTIGSVQAIQATGNPVSEGPLPESTVPKTERRSMGGMADMMKSCRNMMGGKW